MRRFVKILTISLLSLFAVVFAGAWLFLQSPIFSELRREAVSRLLTDQLGQPVFITGDARIRPGRTSKISVVDASIPSEIMKDVELVELKLVSFDVQLLALLEGRIPLENVRIEQLTVNLIRDIEGRTSWSLEPNESDADEILKKTPLRFLYNRNIQVRDVNVVVRNEFSGFEFLFDLETFSLDYTSPKEPVLLASNGLLNGQEFTITGDFPRGSDFTLQARFGAQDLAVTGAANPDVVGGFDANLRFRSPDLLGFQEMLGLVPKIAGTGSVETRLRHVPGVLELGEFDLLVVSDDGRRRELGITGDVGNLLTLDGINLVGDLHLVPDDAEIPPAQRLADIRLLRVTAEVTGEDGEFELADIDAFTNAFESELERIGPARIGRIHRTPGGLLSLSGFEIQSGDPENPFLVASGKIDDLLGFNDVRVDGTITTSPGSIFTSLSPDDLDVLGYIEVEFVFSDDSGKLGLDELTARNVGSDLWSLDASAFAEGLSEHDKISIDFDLSVMSGAKLLEALELTPVVTGPLRLTLSTDAEGLAIDADMKAVMDDTWIGFSVSHREGGRKNIVRGQLESPEIDLDRLVGLGRATVEYLNENKRGKEEASTSTLDLFDDPRDAKPLVLAPDGREIQPLILSTSNDRSLMTSFLRRLDLKIGVLIKTLEGVPGFSGIDSQISMNRGKLQAGPFDARFAGAGISAEAKADIINAPEHVNISGRMNGLSLSRIMELAGQSMDANGTITGNFDLMLNRAAKGGLVRSTSGSAHFNMRDGRIATSLLELAGLGIFPWLFSTELQKGYSNIVCMVAPVAIRKGVLSSNAIVVETNSVQLVARGKLDLPRETIALRAEPRPVGRPLARSAWPFEVTGTLKAPDFNIVRKGGESREKRGTVTRVVNHQPCRVYNVE